jgi:hypothetical protein
MLKIHKKKSFSFMKYIIWERGRVLTDTISSHLHGRKEREGQAEPVSSFALNNLVSEASYFFYRRNKRTGSFLSLIRKTARKGELVLGRASGRLL